MTESIWQSIDYFLYYLTLPPSNHQFEHATFKEISKHIIFVSIILGYTIGRIYSSLVFDTKNNEILCIVSSIITILYLFLQLVKTKNYDVDISYYLNLQHDDIKYKRWIWEKGVYTILNITKQMIPFFIILGISSILFGFFMSYLNIVCFLVVPMIFHVVITDLFIRLFLSQHVNLNYFSPQVSYIF